MLCAHQVYVSFLSVHVVCPANTFKNIDGPSACTSCPSNSESGQGSNSSSQCLCSAGYTGTVSCNPCGVGTYKTSVGSQSCSPCPAAHSTSPSGATDPSLCVCVAGYTPNGPNCDMCAAGKYKIGSVFTVVSYSRSKFKGVIACRDHPRAR